MSTRSGDMIVPCHHHSPKSGQKGFRTSRVLCAFHKFSHCKRGTCEHAEFELQFNVGVGHEEVSCPRWDNYEKDKKEKPSGYEPMRRELCLKDHKLFPFCFECPNGDAEAEGQDNPGWLTAFRKQKKRRRKKEEKIDEERSDDTSDTSARLAE